MYKINIWNRIEKVRAHFQLRFVAIRLYKNDIVKFGNSKDQSKEINCNIGFKQGCHVSPALFGIYIDKLEGCLEEVGNRANINIAGIVTILLLCADDSMEKSPYDLEKQLKIIKYFFLSMGIILTLTK